MKEYKFNIKGAYGETNFGDDLLMLVFENYFLNEFPNSSLNFQGEKTFYPKKMLSKNVTYNQDKEYDWLVYGGGTQFFAFTENYNLSFFQKIKLGISNPQLILNKLQKKKKIDNTAKISFLGFGIGPFHGNESAIQLAKKSVSNANFVGVRDEVSYNYCKEWGVESWLGADVVFSSYFNSLKIKNKINLSSERKIGLIVRDWEFEKTGSSYISKLEEYYKNKDESINIQYIIFAPSKDKNWMKKLKNENALIWNPDKYTIQEFLIELNKFDLVISARYHGAIIASLLGKPVICIEIEPKLRILTQQVKELLLWEKPFDIKQLEILMSKINYKVDYTKSLEERRIKSDLMLEIFKKQLK